MQAYLLPAVFAEARSALEALRGSPLAILSNGSPGMLDSAVRNNDLESCFAEVISVDSVKPTSPLCACTLLDPRL
jgi:2-haloacid dehalogenase